jgi:hypothetical protein
MLQQVVDRQRELQGGRLTNPRLTGLLGTDPDIYSDLKAALEVGSGCCCVLPLLLLQGLQLRGIVCLWLECIMLACCASCSPAAVPWRTLFLR